MTIGSVLYAVGAWIEGWLAVMLCISGRALRGQDERWSLLLAAAFACNTARSFLFALGYGNVPFDGHPKLLTATLADVAIALTTLALMEYVELKSDAKRRIWMFAGPVLALAWALAVAGWTTRGQSSLIVALFVIGWAVMFFRAMLREPRAGHGLVVAATLTFPVVILALKLHLLSFELVAISEIVPLAAIGVTVLTTGLVRANRRAQVEAARTSQALAARERAEAELRAANELLEHRVAQRTATLQETIEGLESFNRSVSHDLRGPLGGISGVARLALAEVHAGHAEKAERMLDAIARQADHSMAMIAALLALARATNTQPQRAHVDTGAMVAEIVATLGGTAGTPARVVVQPLPEVDADPQLLRQVFANLLGNACKFASTSSDPRIEVGHAQTPHGPAFYVRDNGVGFCNADAQRIFKPFQRLHGAAYDGFGVGLSIVLRIVDHHGGEVWADGVPGGGATFWFTLGDAPAPSG